MKKDHPLSRLDGDIRDHIERETQDNIERGMPPEDARHAALRKFGNITLTREDTRAVWSPIWLDELRQDVRYALRGIRRAPGFAAIAVGSSALGIGACAVIFAILNFAMLTPLPVEQPGQLMSLSEHDPRTGQTGGALSYPDFQDLRQARSFEGIAAHMTLSASISSRRGDPLRHWGTLATADYFSVVKPRFAIGRGFDPSRDDRRGAERVVVLSYDLWRNRFGRASDIIGQTIAINARDATIIGVTAAGFRGTEVGFASEFWIPFSMVDEHRTIAAIVDRVMANRDRHWLNAVGRLRPSTDLGTASAELDIIARRRDANAGNDDSPQGFHIERAGQLNPELRRIAHVLFAVALGVTALVLTAACTNVGGLLLGRAWARRREIAARMALGASRARLIRQLLTESMLLASAGGLAALLLALFVVTQFHRVRIPLGWPLDLSISLDGRVVLFCTALSALTAVAFGLIPALRATRLDLVTDLKSHSRGSARTPRYGLRSALVVVQVAICAVLLVCMGLSLQSLHTASGLDVGVSNRNLLLLAFDPALDRRPDVESQRLLRDILVGAQRTSGIQSATLTSAVPLTFIISNSQFVAAEHAKNPDAPRVRTDIYAIAPDFFRTMGIRFVAGEDFGVGTSTTTTAIVNEAFARAAFPNQSPLGRRVLGDGKSLEIAGLVATTKSRTIGEADRPIIYLPILSTYAASESPRGVTLVVRTNGEPSAYTSVVRDVIRTVDPTLAVFDVRTMEVHRRDALISARMVWELSFAAGCIGVVIALVGLYGVISFVVVRRRSEIGIRLAIGARPREVLLMIVRQGLTLASIGTAVGLLAALGITRFGASLLFGVNPTDGLTFAVVSVLLMAVALLACLMPARAAARLDPVKVLRAE